MINCAHPEVDGILILILRARVGIRAGRMEECIATSHFPVYILHVWKIWNIYVSSDTIQVGAHANPTTILF